jgi:hypothetical protein
MSARSGVRSQGNCIAGTGCGPVLRGLPRGGRFAMLRRDMGDGFREAILERAGKAGDRGVPMGQLVDELVGLGHAVEAVEQGIWDMLACRALTPSGFVCRVVRRRDAFGEPVQARTYELLLAPWSADRDRQLDLDLGR